MTFNLRRDVEADGENRWSHRRDDVARLLDHEAPHVIGTQEGLAHQLADLDARLPRYRRVGGCRRGDGSDEANAVFYDPTRLLLVAAGDVWLSDTPEQPGSATWGNRHPRMATWARFTDQETGHSFTLVNTHLDHESATARRRGAEFLARRFPHAILVGDFNAVPGDDVHRFLTSSWRDGLHDVHAPTFHGFRGEPFVRFDYVLAPRGVLVASCRVARHRHEGRFPSDHDPVVADLVLGARQVEAAPTPTV